MVATKMTKINLNKPKKILMITAAFDRNGGTERVIITLGKTLAKRNHEVHLLSKEAINTKIPIPKCIHTHQIRTQKWIYKLFNKKPILHQFYRFISGFLFKSQVKKIACKKHSFDLILSDFKAPKFLFPKQIYNKLYLWIHNDESVRKTTFLAIFLWGYRLSGHRLIIVSNGLKRFLKNFNVKHKEIKTIYNPFDIKEIKKLSKETNSKIPKEPYIIHAGRFCSQKRQDRLLKTFKKLKTPCKLVFLTKHDNALTQLIKENGLENRVIVAGFQKNPYPWFKYAKLSILCSDFEAFGNVIAESLICGCPVVSTDCRSGPNEILVGDLAKWLVLMNKDENKLTDNLAAKIDEALNTKIKIDPSIYERFDADKIADEYLGLIK